MRAVFVDGASLSWMREPLGIGKYNLSGLYEVLTKRVGQVLPPAELLRRPIYTVNSEGMRAVSKNLKTAGFEPILFEYQGHDDQIIISQINGLSPVEVSEIVLVTADQDFVECVRDKAQKGVKVYWVATNYKSGDGHPMVGQMLEEFIDKTENVEFVELANFKEQIMRASWEVRERQPQVGGEDEKKTQTEEIKFVKITLSTTATHDKIFEVLRAVMGVVAKFPEVKYSVEG